MRARFHLKIIAFLLAAMATPALAQEKPKDYSQIPDAYIEEAMRFNNQCEASPNMRRFYDCECLAVKFLDTRIEHGEGIDGSAIMLSISKECPDATEEAGYQYENCLANAPIMPPEIPPEEFCTCFANTLARLYEKHRPGTGSKASIAMQTEAMAICRNPRPAPGRGNP